MSANPQAAIELRGAARHLLQHPLTCAEYDPDVFREDSAKLAALLLAKHFLP